MGDLREGDPAWLTGGGSLVATPRGCRSRDRTGCRRPGRRSQHRCCARCNLAARTGHSRGPSSLRDLGRWKAMDRGGSPPGRSARTGDRGLFVLLGILSLVLSAAVVAGWFHRTVEMPDAQTWISGRLVSATYDPPDQLVELYLDQGDGQLFAAHAHDPLVQRPDQVGGGPAEQAYRFQRPLYGWLGWMASAGRTRCRRLVPRRSDGALGASPRPRRSSGLHPRRGQPAVGAGTPSRPPGCWRISSGADRRSWDPR